MLLAFLVENGGFAMHKNFWGWSLENINAGTVETKYIAEYINDDKTWEKFCKTEDIDLYSKREYDNISEAISFYLTWFISDKCYDIKLWEQIFVNGEMVLEQMIEPENTLTYYLQMQVNRDMANKIYSAENRERELEKENNLLMSFIKYTKQENMLNEFMRMKAEEK